MVRWFRRFMRALLLLLVGLMVPIVGLVGQVEASDGMRGDKCLVAEGEYIADDFYFFCRRLDIYGVIDGDVIGVAVEVTLWPSSVVTGDLWIGGGRLEVAGTVGDDVHYTGVTVTLREGAEFPKPRIDLATVALNAEVDPEVRIPGNLLMYGYQARVDGVIGGDIDFTGETLTVNGTVDGNVDARVGDARRSTDLPALPFWDVKFRNPGLWLGDEASIKGDLVYRAASPSTFSLGAVEGTPTFVLSDQQLDITKAAKPNEAAQIVVDYIRRTITDLFTLLVVGLLALRVAPNTIRQPASHVRQRVVSAVGWGLVTFMFSVPVAIAIIIIGLILLLVLYVFNLVSLMLLVVVVLAVTGSGLLGGFYFLLFFMGRIVISFLIGRMAYRYVLHLPDWGRMRQWVFTLALGAAVYSLIANVPLPAVGLIFEVVTALAGGGAVIMTLRDALIEIGLFAPSLEPVPGLLGEAVETDTLLIPAVSQRERLPEPAPPPGMTNLPPGFTGFDEDW